MHRILAVAVLAAVAAGAIAGCSGSRSKSGSGWWGDTDWSRRDKPYAESNDRSKIWGGDDWRNNQWGSGAKALANSRTYDPNVHAAVHDLNDGKLEITRLNAARRLGEMGAAADTNLAIEALEHAGKDSSMEVRRAAAVSLQQIGSDNAMHHLAELQEKGFVSTDWTPGAAGAGTGAVRYESDVRYEAQPRPDARQERKVIKSGDSTVTVEQKTTVQPSTQPVH
jgi:hypothetical protein